MLILGIIFYILLLYSLVRYNYITRELFRAQMSNLKHSYRPYIKYIPSDKKLIFMFFKFWKWKKIFPYVRVTSILTKK